MDNDEQNNANIITTFNMGMGMRRRGVELFNHKKEEGKPNPGKPRGGGEGW